MQDWKCLSADDRVKIEDNLMRALVHLGVKGAVTRWDKPSRFPYWQLTIQNSFCASKPRPVLAKILEQAIARSGVEVPTGSITLCGEPNL